MRNQTDDWPEPRHGDPVEITVSEFDVPYLRHICKTDGREAAVEIIHWAVEQVIGRGISTEWEAQAVHLLSLARAVLREKRLQPIDRVFLSDESTITLPGLCAREMDLIPDEVAEFLEASIGDEVVTGGGAVATTRWKRIV